MRTPARSIAFRTLPWPGPYLGLAEPGVDFVSTEGTLTFGPGETVKDILIPVLDDSIAESTETFDVQLLSSDGTGLPGGVATATVSILENDSSFGVYPNVNPVPERAGEIVLNVYRQGRITGTATVHYSTTSGTAIEGKDFEGRSGILQFGDGEGFKTVTIPLLDDREREIGRAHV